jgi:very-short-patch-repair endonuclease
MVAAQTDFRSVKSRRDQQRFNVAFSRAQDRMYLVRSLSLEDLDPLDLKAKAILHFQNPMKGSASKEGKGRALCESDFEREVYDSLLAQEYIVTPQVPVGSFRIDMVVEGGGDRRLAVELDGEKWHGPEKWWADHRRQLALERMGWTFWRCWGSDWRLNRSACLEDLTSVLEAMGIRPGNGATTGSHQFTEHRVLENAPTSKAAEEQVSAELFAEPGDAVEIEFSEREPPKRATYSISLNSHHPNNGIVRVDSPIGQILLGASVGDDLQFPETNENVIVIGIFKARGETPSPSSPNPPYRPEDRLSLH